ncbi:MAG: hypothetical protein A3C85_02080 [Candidatus Doudnabacteria bacterium RIFCSPHIGHO2_02_FULL_48_21]|uniref:Translation initiation factor IF-2 n=1 Tax=Candidatus Doudnabacteria bacterium RIFCSPLOWO2_02_FULL_48_13 TaxID=1817845 RepID=A0A1F5QCK7_9BACT|nr:MAG: hypothetical protein A3K05_01865 [Candidatus Doudnabacteria bacterium RIFCSPHIGHO2_01_48_18]OGE77346.1 MAG: hypothetical protein A2668_03160 [Candidatus Doudnabacteria bacterium RIFCSPHIGHO2_01_FULL_48_180]OGE93120.1 MAG: hypothetical protein A3C85_02080 [Candidatus Doudnabacteria bacterium RIFCSPHIGHO2_02_FULL_48_21]OGE99943.1 MAG: hypothetical protein A3J05_04935 [Candidatus Doudnabacteria bacterium RIFCSPLOWO2_02_FULL_48_13]OGF02219.1 MAG: hypothetical protein A3G07_00040 [Candidatus
MSVQELRNKMRVAGFRVSMKARKVDNSLAKEIITVLSGRVVTQAAAPEKVSKITVPPLITVKDFSEKLKQPVTAVIKKLIQNGVMATINEEIDAETAGIIASEFGVEVEVQKKESEGTKLALGYVYDLIAKEDPANLVLRAPIVAVMGHVDHGKTTLLDTIRKTNVVATEAGAITQHIGAYQVEVPPGEKPKSRESEANRGIPRQARDDFAGRKITFLDTPGHEAFAAMRARGANVTDIIVLVVAADDSVKPQTLEVINRAKLTKTPMIVAINKIDKPEANADRVKSDLSSLGVTIEEWGGTTPAVAVSAKTGLGIDKLLETILLVAEMEELKANPAGQTLGTVIESHLSRGQGAVATVLVQNGTLKVGDTVIVGTAFGKVRTMEDALGRKLKEVTPSQPVLISGISDVPEVGDILKVTGSLEEAKSQAITLQKLERVKRLMSRSQIKADPNTRELKLILRADVQGSLGAITDALGKLGTEDVKLNIVDQKVAEITESDIQLAENTQSTIIGFHTRMTPGVAKLAKQKNITVDIYDIIYELIEDVTQALLVMMPMVVVETILGRAKIKAVFRTEKDLMIVGGEVAEGKIADKKKFRIYRDKSPIGEGKIDELQQNKIEVSEVGQGKEFGLKIKVKTPVKAGDVLEIFDESVKKKGT